MDFDNAPATNADEDGLTYDVEMVELADLPTALQSIAVAVAAVIVAFP